MFQVPVHIWQQIAEYSPKETRWGRAMMEGQPAIDRLLAEVERSTRRRESRTR